MPMKMGAHQRWIVWVVLLILTLGAALWVREIEREGEAAELAEVVENRARGRALPVPPGEQTQDQERVQLEKLTARGLTGIENDPFAPRSWRKPERKPTVQAQPIAPALPPAAPLPPVTVAPGAPPLPFVYMGKLLSDEVKAVFLVYADRNLIVREGQIVESIYRLDNLSDTQLTFTHLPSGLQQKLSIGEPQ